METIFILLVVLLSIAGLIRLFFKRFKGQCICCDCDKDGNKDKKNCSCKK
ncbi:MAG: hypothetical protein PHR82_06000 [Endomicrobiaceae bacterium]|nr:hypothetical protein [Endomicrobiaceae bacterium]